MLRIVALLYAGDTGLAGLHSYETQVMPTMVEHGGRLLWAFNPEQSESDGPDEIHVLEFPSVEAFQSYRKDARLEALADLRNRSIARTVVYSAQALVEYLVDE